MNMQDIERKIRLMREMQRMAEEAQAEADSLKDEIKAYSMALILSAQLNGSDTLRCRPPAIYTRMLSSRPTRKTRIYSVIFS